MKKFITTLAATLVIGSAASAATPTFNVNHEEVLPALAEANTPATFSVYNEEVLPALVAANTPPTFNVVREEILPAMNRAVADVDPFAEQIVGGLGPQINIPATFSVYHEEVLPAMNRVVADADPFAEVIVGGLGPQLPHDPMRVVDYGFVQVLLQQNADPFAEHIVGGLGPQPFNAVTYSEVFVDGQIHIIPATDVETFSVAGN